MIYVFNKIDKLDAEERKNVASQLFGYQPHVIIHTMSKEGVEPLLTLLRTQKL